MVRDGHWTTHLVRMQGVIAARSKLESIRPAGGRGPKKAASAAVFHERYKAARKHPEYLRLLAEHRAKYERA